jgi:hypothetical protein
MANGGALAPLVLPPIRTRSKSSAASPSVPEFHRISLGDILLDAGSSARGLSPPVRIPTDPGARYALDSSQRTIAAFIPCRCMNISARDQWTKGS